MVVILGGITPISFDSPTSNNFPTSNDSQLSEFIAARCSVMASPLCLAKGVSPTLTVPAPHAVVSCTSCRVHIAIGEENGKEEKGKTKWQGAYH